MTHALIKETRIVHRCWYKGNIFYKQLPAYNADNEMYFLTAMQYSGYVPRWPKRHGRELISMEFIENEMVTNPEEFLSHYSRVLDALREANVRHGDLTEYSVLVRNNRPVLVDFAEARILDSPLPSKREEGDAYWLRLTMERLSHA